MIPNLFHISFLLEHAFLRLRKRRYFYLRLYEKMFVVYSFYYEIRNLPSSHPPLHIHLRVVFGSNPISIYTLIYSRVYKHADFFPPMSTGIDCMWVPNNWKIRILHTLHWVDQSNGDMIFHSHNVHCLYERCPLYNNSILHDKNVDLSFGWMRLVECLSFGWYIH
jgi:hypothetical protein